MGVPNRELKLKLHAADCHCHWCGKPTFIRNIKNGIIPNDEATIDHIISRFSIFRWVQTGGSRKVLSCYECNYTRSLKEHKQLGKLSLSKRERLKLKGIPSMKTVQEVINELQKRGIPLDIFIDGKEYLGIMTT